MNKRGTLLLKQIIEILIAVFIVIILIIAAQRFLSTYFGNKEEMQAKGTLDKISRALDKADEIGESQPYLLTAPLNWHLVAFESNQNANTENGEFEKPKEMFGKTTICICEKKKCNSDMCRTIKIPLRQNKKQANIKIGISEIWFTNLDNYYNLSRQEPVSKIELSQAEKEEFGLNMQNIEQFSNHTNKSSHLHYSEISQYFANAEDFEKYIKSIIFVESRGDDDALSICGAVGLMQLMPDTAREQGLNVTQYVEICNKNKGNDCISPYAECSYAFECNSKQEEKCNKSEDERFNAEKNIEAGTTYIIKLIKQFNDKGLALAAYNAGSSNVQKYCNTTIVSCSAEFAGKKYAQKVLAYYYELA